MDDLLEAISDLVTAQMAHDKACGGYDGHSWDYFGHDAIQEVEKAKARVQTELRALLRAEIREVLAEDARECAKG